MHIYYLSEHDADGNALSNDYAVKSAAEAPTMDVAVTIGSQVQAYFYAHPEVDHVIITRRKEDA